ncbi:polyphosphate--glucose phosphotransferase [Rubrobacter calidifluminis]|uniref:polyphosphate--glucose phosphotransferase n=1 Tax=Rubrobacter calidifluminis TaxID=1392640 RepID=UPI00235FC9B4|nr:ROK family protein [Rubrobacter calidifluminis]
MELFGLDIGGSGIKGAPVDVGTGELLSERVRVGTPQPATPGAIVESALEVLAACGWEGPVGCGFPAVVKDGVVRTAANVDESNVGFDLQDALERETRHPVRVINDADAAGLAEMRWGAGRGEKGVVLMLTLGTGIGTALFTGGRLVPNTELGHIEIAGYDAEMRASDGARKREKLGWKKWSRRLEEYIRHIEDLLWPDLIIIGGGVSKKFEKFMAHVDVRTRVVPARMHNAAGIAGAALAASEVLSPADDGGSGSDPAPPPGRRRPRRAPP